MSKLVLLAVVVVGFGSFGCHKDPEYCPGVTNDNCNFSDGGGSDSDSGPSGCTGDPQCSGATPVCDTSNMTCVQCTAGESAACVGTTPVCGSDQTCRACTMHSECVASDACLPDGSCGDDTNVAYVNPTGTDNTSCTKAMPCTSVAKALATNRPYVKFTETTNEQVTINNQTVTLLADAGAQLSSTSNGVILTIMGTSNVAIYDLEVTGASGATQGIGISIPAGSQSTVEVERAKVTNSQYVGISVGGGALTVTRSIVSGNSGGGISITGGTFILVNNFFFSNGSGTSAVGGVSITTTQSATNRLDFNSFNKNATQDGLGTAIQCIAGTFTARNNIMSNNGTLTDMNQTGGTCAHAYSIARPGTVPTGTGNMTGDPLFVNTTTGDLHIQTGSPAIGAADPSSDLTGIASVDIDGDPRMAPTDIGADKH